MADETGGTPPAAATAAPVASQPLEAPESTDSPIITIGTVEIYRDGPRITAKRLWWTSGFEVDADGAPDAYAPAPLQGRDLLRNAGKPGNWYGIITDTDKPSGTPIVQGPNDPCPGYYVSGTALSDHRRGTRDPLRYVDATHVPYVSVPEELLPLGVHLGDLACVEYRGQWCPAIVADVGPRGKIGEGSIALAAQLGMNADPRHGGCGAGVTWTVYLGSAADPAWPRTQDAILAAVQQLSGKIPAC